MGIFDFVKQGVQEMLIQRPDDKKGLIVYKHPDATIPMYAQLTVDADEAAVFFRDGAVVGTLRTAGAGRRHMLSSQNIPFLGRLIDKVTGGNVFLAELFFVTMRPIYDVRFGGELGYMEDPLLGEMVTPRIFGTFAFQVTDPERFIVNYVGVRQVDDNEQVLRWITGLFMNSVSTVVGEILVEEQKSLLQIMPLQNKIAQRFLARCPDLERIGCRILDVGQFRINLSDEDEARLKEAQSEIGKAKRQARVAKIGIDEAAAKAQQRQFQLDQDFQQDARYVKGLAGGSFAQYAAGKAMMGAGEGMAQGGASGGGEMMAGAGLGVGFAMAGQMAQAFQGGGVIQQPQAPAHTAPSPTTESLACPSCQAQVPAGRFCAQCGAELAPQPRFCPSCGQQGASGAKFCSQCGTAFGV